MNAAEARDLLALAREAELTGPRAEEWADRLQPRRDELHQAAEWLAANGEEDEAAELAANVWRLWLLTGDLAGGRAFLAAALGDSDEATAARARALYGDGLLAFRQGAQQESRERNEEALGIAEELADPELVSQALVGLGRVAFRDGDYARVRELASRARELARDADPAADVAPLHMLAAGTRLGGDYERAAALYEESLELNARLGDSYMRAVELHNLGHVHLHRGDLAAAEDCFGQAAEFWRGSSSPYDVAIGGLNRAALAYHRGEREEATAGLAEAERTLAGAGIELDPDDRFEVDWLRERLESG